MQQPGSEAVTDPRFVLTLAAASKRGQVAAVTTLLERRGAYIEEFAAFDDVLSRRFLARYMQVLSEDLCHRLAGRVINGMRTVVLR